MSAESFEIWRDRATGARHLVGCRAGRPSVASGELSPAADPRQVLERRGGWRPNGPVLARMLRHPEGFRREYYLDGAGRAVLADDPAVGPGYRGGLPAGRPLR